MSKINYYSAIWSSTSESNIKKLELVRIFATNITGRRKFDSITPLYVN